jgi:hypothetical protein
MCVEVVTIITFTNAVMEYDARLHIEILNPDWILGPSSCTSTALEPLNLLENQCPVL